MCSSCDTSALFGVFLFVVLPIVLPILRKREDTIGDIANLLLWIYRVLIISGVIYAIVSFITSH